MEDLARALVERCAPLGLMQSSLASSPGAGRQGVRTDQAGADASTHENQALAWAAGSVPQKTPTKEGPVRAEELERD